MENDARRVGARKNIQAKQTRLKTAIRLSHRMSGDRGVWVAELPFCSQRASVQPSPEDEVPAGSVPEAADEHGEQEVDVGSRHGDAIAAQGDIE